MRYRLAPLREVCTLSTMSRCWRTTDTLFGGGAHAFCAHGCPLGDRKVFLQTWLPPNRSCGRPKVDVGEEMNGRDWKGRHLDECLGRILDRWHAIGRSMRCVVDQRRGLQRSELTGAKCCGMGRCCLGSKEQIRTNEHLSGRVGQAGRVRQAPARAAVWDCEVVVARISRAGREDALRHSPSTMVSFWSVFVYRARP